MPKTTRTPRTYTRNHTKRHGRHHKKSHDYKKVYWPYLPLVVSIVMSLLLNIWHPSKGATLAYATEMSTSGLLSSTNTQRNANGVAGLLLNQQLSNAAQAKANDMVARNYWSHVTPDGQAPWVFIQNAGYKYTKAGENLAYGFSTSSATVTGWMNSPSHKANMLDGGYTEVGFGFANGANFNGDGEQTVVVAMYGKPQTLAATAPTTPTPTQSTPKQSTKAAPAAQQPAAQAPTPTPAAPAEQKPDNPAPITTEQPLAAVTPTQDVARVQTMTGGYAPWTLTVTGFLLAIVIITRLIHHSMKLRHLLHDSTRLVAHHPLLDSTILGLIILGITLAQTVGTIL